MILLFMLLLSVFACFQVPVGTRALRVQGFPLTATLPLRIVFSRQGSKQKFQFYPAR
jgi:uncharacterized protein (DUF302 family)